MSSEVRNICYPVRYMPLTGLFFFFLHLNRKFIIFFFQVFYFYIRGNKKEILRTVVTCCQIDGSLWWFSLYVVSDSCNPMDCRLLCPLGLSRQEYWSGLPFPSPFNWSYTSYTTSWNIWSL